MSEGAPAHQHSTHSTLQLIDLKTRRRALERTLTVKVPAPMDQAIERLAGALGTSKTEIATALLKTGVKRAHRLKPLNQKT
ncbi:MAG: hypothetical protein ACE5I7_15290 [Candidatus Binatia bacterium]